ncbi:MAG: phage terminase large subunit [Gammaproteobacteria bacterium]|nr:phage terminase large subunit [Gammaproteobacteria bacterium]NIR85216.1 phage terminase large subunit [Gammaproteobacteria bacterium]NIU06266.1 phage terminase large subunit [Gammaproteobacteria bacterium]NIX87539.1 phage terminase large subunit [Gammaproteobacteria bacterium]
MEGWHVDAIVEHLEAVTRGDIRHLLINVPPGSTKTLTVQILWPAWEWICNQHPRNERSPDGFRPDVKYMFATYEADLARQKSLKCRELMESAWYQALFEERWQPNPAQWGAGLFANDKGGWRLATSVGGKATGMHPDRQVFDDPIKPQDVLGGTKGKTKIVLENVWTWWTQTMSTRKADEHTARIGIMQRIHESDLAGRIIKEGGYEVLRIPMHFESKFPCRTVLRRDAQGEPEKIWEDPRSEEGELMCPARFSVDECAQRKKDLGPQGYAAQEQQRPAPAGGALYKAHYFKHWRVRPLGGTWIIVGDCTFKQLDTSDYVALQVWCAQAPDFFLIDQIRERMDVLETCEAIITLRSRYPQVGATIIEDAANGPAVVQIMQRTVPGMELVPTGGGKYARAHASSVPHASGNVYLPPLERAPWVQDYIEEHLSFPVGAYDDCVDAQSHAIMKLSQGMMDYEKMLETMRGLGVEV